MALNNPHGVGIITADPITTQEQLEAVYQQAIRGRHISEIAPVLALRNRAFESFAVSETGEIALLRKACDAAFAFIDSHVADPDITDEMVRKYRDYKDARAALDGSHVHR
jgi:hypothetical protein